MLICEIKIVEWENRESSTFCFDFFCKLWKCKWQSRKDRLQREEKRTFWKYLFKYSCLFYFVAFTFMILLLSNIDLSTLSFLVSFVFCSYVTVQGYLRGVPSCAILEWAVYCFLELFLGLFSLVHSLHLGDILAKMVESISNFCDKLSDNLLDSIDFCNKIIGLYF